MRATLSTCLREEDFAVAVPLAERFTAGVAGVIDRHGLPWHVQRLGCRAEYWFCPPPRDGAAAAAAVDEDLEGFLHLWCLNRGVLLTPFHNMALLQPAPHRGRRRPPHRGLRRGGRRADAGRLTRPAMTPRRRVPGDVLVHLRRARDHLDRHYAEDFDLDLVAALAAMSRSHFVRSFAATYGTTPAAYLAQRRIARAQDLLRAANLTVTEVCHAVGYSSLGSFSSTFREIVGETPSAFQRRYAASGNPRIPGCYLFMAGVVERDNAATQEKRPGAGRS